MSPPVSHGFGAMPAERAARAAAAGEPPADHPRPIDPKLRVVLAVPDRLDPHPSPFHYQEDNAA